MKNILTLKEITKKDIPKAGGKGASLGEMLHVGINVPPGFIVLGEAFRIFLAENNLSQEIIANLNTINSEAIHSIEKASGVIQDLIHATKIPEDLEREIILSFRKLEAPYVAVRSSATTEDGIKAAWAGQLDTFLNTTKKALIPNIKYCWASLFTPRALHYRLKQELQDTPVSVAIVIQKMIACDAAGTAFSIHPITEDDNQMIIEAGWGLGEALVSGDVTPDSYVIAKDSLEIIDTHINTQKKALVRSYMGGNEWLQLSKTKSGKQILSKELITTLAKKVMSIEKHFNFPVDVEWGIKKGAFYIFQARPITTL